MCLTTILQVNIKTLLVKVITQDFKRIYSQRSYNVKIRRGIFQTKVLASNHNKYKLPNQNKIWKC